MAPRNFISFAGFILVFVGIYCPLISPLGLVKWNLYDLNETLAIILGVAALNGMSFVFRKRDRGIKFSAYSTLGLVMFIFLCVVFKVNTAFGFIPFPKLSRTLSGLIHYRWGWFLLFAGAILALLGSGKRTSLHTS